MSAVSSLPTRGQGLPEPSLFFSNIPSNQVKIGGQVFVCGHALVTVRQGYTNQNPISIYLVSPGPARFLATSLEVGRTVDLGSFPPGTELVFGMSPGPPSNRGRISIEWYTGPGARNVDHKAHGVVAVMDPVHQMVVFEDNGDDWDYNDVAFQVTASIPYSMRLTASVPDTVLPSVMPRLYKDTQGGKSLFPRQKRQEPVLCRVQLVSLDGSRLNKVKIRVSLASGEGESGHLSELHKIRRPHGWLVPVLAPDDPNKESATANSAPDPIPALPTDSISQAPADDTVPSDPAPIEGQDASPAKTDSEPREAEHDSPLFKLLNRPLEPGDPGGETKPGPLEVESDENGSADFYYLPPEVTGVETLTAELAEPACIDSIQQSFTIKQDGFVDLSRVKFSGSVIQSRDVHASLFWVTPATAEKVKRAALLYVAKQNGDAEVQGLVRDLAARGYDFPDLPLQNRILPQGPDVVRVLDANLFWGGLFDPEGDYATAYWGHRDGYEVDLMTRHLVRGDPLRAKPADATGDSALGEHPDTARDDLVRRLQYRRLQLMIDAVKEAGGSFIPESARYSEGDHLHVNFGEPLPEDLKVEAPPVDRHEVAPPAKAPSGPAPKGLTPANPNQILP